MIASTNPEYVEHRAQEMEMASMTNEYDRLYEQMNGHSPPEQVISANSDADILSPGRGFMGGFDYTMQLMVGCPGACLFCYVKNGYLLAPPQVKGNKGDLWGYILRYKQKLIEKLRAHLGDGDLADKTIYWSGVTDPYASSPKDTRAVWETLCDTPPALRPRRIAVQTRFRPDRDVEIIAEYEKGTHPADGGPAVVFSYSIGTDRDEIIRAWERATPALRQRIFCVHRLRESGLFVVVTLSPFGPWNDLLGVLHQFKELGVSYVTMLFFKCGTRSANTPRNFLDYLKETHPELLDDNWQGERIMEARLIFGEKRVLIGQDGFQSLTQPHTILK
jgi:DNA repair photolyase